MQGLTTQDIASQVCHISDGAIPNFFDGLETKYLQNKYYMENFTSMVLQLLIELYLKGALLAFLGDNLASHLIGGFKEGISFALRICRSCMITNETSGECFSEHQCTLQTPEAHEYQCLSLDGPLYSHYSTLYGINRRSILEDVPGYFVVTNLPHDIMHDIYEGVAKELSLFLTYCTSHGYFTIYELNKRIQHNCSRPTLIDTTLSTQHANEFKIRQSASQMLSLLQEILLLTGDTIPYNDEYYHSLLILTKISAIALCPVISHDLISYLEILVEEKITCFKDLYPSATIIPKMHYMVHYAPQLRRFGPLINKWTMRCEAKLSFIKLCSQRSNFKQVSKTVAKAHQLWLCYKLESCISVVNIDFDFGKKVETILAFESTDIQNALRCTCTITHIESTIIARYKWLRLQSNIYKIGMFVLTRFDDFEPLN
uniref:Uncharacterized protein n=1 Tax=Amphimedon queenslandica TaxID=400682 RepID=A0A1X7TA47_AMPQE